ncbi:alpha beta hydrolase [Nannochloropsis oceanica]
MLSPAADEEELFGSQDNGDDGEISPVARRHRHTPPPGPSRPPLPPRRSQPRARPDPSQAVQPPYQSRQRQAQELKQQEEELLHEHRLQQQQQQQHQQQQEQKQKQQQQQQLQQPPSRRSPISSFFIFALTIATLLAVALLLSAAFPSSTAHFGFPLSSSSPFDFFPPSDPSSILPEGAIPLWKAGQVPLAKGRRAKDTPLLIPFYPDEAKWAGLSVVIMPGGGYRFLSMEKEGREVARWLCDEEGIAAFVLQYRVGPDGYHHPTQLLDGRRSVKKARELVRQHYRRRAGGGERELLGGAAATAATAATATTATVEGVMGVMGFSAGGHLSASVLVHPEEDEETRAEHVKDATEGYSEIFHGSFFFPYHKQAFLLPFPTANLTTYYSIEKQVPPPSSPPSAPPSFPPIFLYHSEEDKTVSIENSIFLAAALRNAGLDHDLCYFDKGKHGMGLGVKNGVRHPWTRLALAFLRREHLLREGGGEDEKKEEVPREDKRRHGPWGQYICTGIP